MLKIKKIDNSKDKITQPKYASEGYIPKLLTSTLITGRSGSGKSLLLCNLLSRPEFYEGFHNRLILFSLTGDVDDFASAMNVEPEDIHVDLDKGLVELESILKAQRQVIKSIGIVDAPSLCVILDDCISHKKFMKSEMVIKLAVMSRHFKASVFILSQSYTSIPRVVRLQASNIMLFAPSANELQILCEHECPGILTKNKFKEIVNFATREDYAFLYINKTQPQETMLRCCLDQIIKIQPEKKK